MTITDKNDILFIERYTIVNPVVFEYVYVSRFKLLVITSCGNFIENVGMLSLISGMIYPEGFIKVTFFS
jgi:hypothetical protein